MAKFIGSPEELLAEKRRKRIFNTMLTSLIIMYILVFLAGFSFRSTHLWKYLIFIGLLGVFVFKRLFEKFMEKQSQLADMERKGAM